LLLALFGPHRFIECPVRAQQRPFPYRMFWNGSSELLIQQLKEVAYSFERLSIAIADIDYAIAFAL
jgi:hypothetical protein